MHEHLGAKLAIAIAHPRFAKVQAPTGETSGREVEHHFAQASTKSMGSKLGEVENPPTSHRRASSTWLELSPVRGALYRAVGGQKGRLKLSPSCKTPFQSKGILPPELL